MSLHLRANEGKLGSRSVNGETARGLPPYTKDISERSACTRQDYNYIVKTNGNNVICFRIIYKTCSTRFHVFNPSCT